MNRENKREAVNRITNAIIAFYKEYPLYYYILSRMSRVADAKIGTMGVGFKTHKALTKKNVDVHLPTLFYCPEYVLKCSPKKLMVVLHHECLHVVLRHLSRMGSRDGMLFNIAADVVVNSMISEISELEEEFDGVLAEKIPTLKDLNVRESTAEEIYNILLPEHEELKKKIQEMIAAGKLVMDNHDEWSCPGPGNGEGEGEGQGSAASIQEAAALDQVIKDSVKDLGGLHPGNIPGQVQREIDELMKSKVDWRKLLTMFAQNVVKDDKEPTWRRVNRRMVGAGAGYVAPGRRKEWRPNILVAVDNSGSVCGPTYNLFMAQVVKLGEICEELNMVGVDTRVNFEISIIDGKLPENFDLNSGGGTEFQPAFDHAKEHGYNGVIYLTDGHANNNINTHGIQTMFAICPGGAEVVGHKNIKIEDD